MNRNFSWIKQPEWVFLIIALVFGAVLCFLIPVQAGFDEITHIAKIWEISGGYFLPNQRLSQGPYLPEAFVDISYRNQYFFDPVDRNYFAVFGKERIDWNNFVNYQTRSSYISTVYLPQAIAVGLVKLNAAFLLAAFASGWRFVFLRIPWNLERLYSMILPTMELCICRIGSPPMVLVPGGFHQ